uniref:Pentatricopeptide repeat-containing protein At5g08490 n=1 Tax=Rhizophora mucronata TaxID=61149 RepID=A0A2P2NHN5_RHIMU
MIHCYALRHSALLLDVSIWNALVSFYMRVGQVEKAEMLFRRIESKDLVSWNAIIAGYATNGEWSKSLESFRELLLLEKAGLDSVTLVSILPACAELKNLPVGKEIHCYVLKHPCLSLDTSVGNALIKFYAKCRVMDAAYHTFLMICRKDLISWNSMLDAFVELRCDVHFLELFQWMLREGVKPDSITILATLHFCSNILKLNKVKETHAYVMRCGILPLDAEHAIGNGILDAYAKCGMIEYAFKFFHSISKARNLVTFNSMISGYVNFGLVDDACMIFSKMPASDLTTWNLMVRAYAENDRHDQALGLFHELQAQGMKPDAVTIMSLLPVCTQAASLHLIKQCHGYSIRACFDDAHLEAALLDVYAKCGSIDCACKLFDINPDKDLVVLTAMIGGYAMHGMGEEALKVFSHMLGVGIKPDHVIITAILSACSHSGLVDEGLKIFYSIEKDHGMRPTMEQYSCVVDLLARGGQISHAYSIVTSMAMEPSTNIWSTLLGACRTHHNVELGRAVADHLFKIEGNDIGNYVILSNLYAADAKWDDVVEVRKLMRTRDLKKPAGFSWIEVGRRKNLFLAGDSCHPQRIGIYNVLGILGQQIKESIQLNQQFDLQLVDCHK